MKFLLSSPVIGPSREKMMYVTLSEMNCSLIYSLVAICCRVKFSSDSNQKSTTAVSFNPTNGCIAYPKELFTLESFICDSIQRYITLIFSSKRGSSPSKSITIIAELTADSGHFSSMCSKPTLVSSSGGNASLDAMEKSACKNGRPAPSSMINVGISTAHGLSITKLAIFAHIPLPSSFSVLKANGTVFL